MTDITREPYAEWLEETLQELVEMHPARMAIVAIMEDDETGTAYFNAENASRAQMIRAIAQDSILDFIRVNADLIGEILRGEEDEEAAP